MSLEAGSSTRKSKSRNNQENGEHVKAPGTPISRHVVSSMLASKAPPTPGLPGKPHLFKTSTFKPKASSTSIKRITSSVLSPLVARSPSISSTSGRKKAKFQWVKGELLGKGSYAKVYLALNATTGEIMAVKQVELHTSEIESQSSHSRKIIEALELERKTLMELDHVNIVQYLGYEESPRYLSIFLEYVPGGTICTLLRTVGGAFPEPVSKHFAAQILDGLEYLHSLGILHRDLKSDNILVEPTGICKIADFGISKKMELEEGNRPRTGMRGTIFWMAPEVVSPDKEKGYDLKIDIWSTGCVMLEMWTGVRPWNGEAFWAVASKLIEHKQAPPLPVDIVLSEEALDFRSKCFQPNPEDRPSAGELRRHGYLVLPPGWKYEVSEFEETRRLSFSNQSRKTHVSKRSTASKRQEEPDATQVDVGTITQDNFRSRTVIAGTTIASGAGVETIRPVDPDDNGPPLVFITPPGTPSIGDHDDFYEEETTSQPSESGRSSWKSKFRGPKTYWLANPDPEPEARPEPAYVYKPPPLPSIDERAKYSNRLAPPAVVSAPYLPFESMPAGPSTFRAPKAEVELFNAQVKPRSSIWNRKGKAASRLSQTTRATGTFGSESDDDEAFWAKRPETPNSDPNQKSIVEVNPADRPNTATVYHNLQDFFPNCDLNMIVDDGGADAREKERKRQRQKSIRIVAEEHNRRHHGQRRRTKLWDSNMEEIHAFEI